MAVVPTFPANSGPFDVSVLVFNEVPHATLTVSGVHRYGAVSAIDQRTFSEPLIMNCSAGIVSALVAKFSLR